MRNFLRTFSRSKSDSRPEGALAIALDGPPGEDAAESAAAGEAPAEPIAGVQGVMPPVVPRFRSEFGGLWTDLTTAEEMLEGKVALGLMDEEDARHVRHWIEKGFVILPQAVPEEDIDAGVEDFRRVLTGDPKRLKASYWSSGELFIVDAQPESMWNKEAKLLDLHMYSSNIQKLIFSEKIVRFLNIIFERPPLAFQSLTFEIGSEQPLHRDSAFVLVDSALELVASWIALEDIAEGSGELLYYPGSHHLPPHIFHGQYLWAPPGTPELARYAESLQGNAESHGCTLERFVPRKGDVLIWSAELMHGGAPRQHEDSTRRSIVTHYCPADRAPMYAWGNEAFKKAPSARGGYIIGQY